jgi:hypothetical protein
MHFFIKPLLHCLLFITLPLLLLQWLLALPSFCSATSRNSKNSPQHQGGCHARVCPYGYPLRLCSEHLEKQQLERKQPPRSSSGNVFKQLMHLNASSPAVSWRALDHSLDSRATTLPQNSTRVQKKRAWKMRTSLAMNLTRSAT